jgi:hypothetical protein
VLTCSSAGARAAIAQTHPRVALSGGKVLVRPGQADAVVCFDSMRDGFGGMAVSLFSGGTAGDVGWLFFVPENTGWRLTNAGAGYKLRLLRKDSQLVVVQPVYRRNDPNCCPSGGFDRTNYRWNGDRLAVAKRWHTRTPG